MDPKSKIRAGQPWVKPRDDSWGQVVSKSRGVTPTLASLC